MSYEEMRKEFFHDFIIATAKARVTYRSLRSEMHKRHQQHAVETITWKSPLHNTWMTFYDISNNNVDCLHVCITMDHGNLLRTLYPIAPDENNDIFLAEYNTHFYKRYNERLQLNLPKPSLIVKHYFKKNIKPEGSTRLSRTDDKETFKIFMPVTGGVMLGYQYSDKKWLEGKTFISNEMLRGSQVEVVEFLKNYKLDDSGK
jgi:hypothetical protein